MVHVDGMFTSLTTTIAGNSGGVDVLSSSRAAEDRTSLIYSTRGVRDRGVIDVDADDVSVALECLVDTGGLVRRR